jgi:diguanylate cyclase (GGDEF)-like protein/PAS domain S-box-containing protein
MRRSVPDVSEDSRLHVLDATGLLDSAPEAAFDRLTRLATHLLDAPIALVSLVDRRRQFFKSALGLAEPWASRRETPLTHSFCQHVVHDRAPLVVSDAREHPRLRDNLAIRDLGFVAYAGFPLFIAGEAIGAFCVIDRQPRAWAADKLRLVEDLAALVVSEIELRLALQAEHAQRALTSAIVESIGDACLAVDASGTLVIANQAARGIFEAAEPGKPMPSDWARLNGSRRDDGSPLPSSEGALLRGLRGEDTNGLTFTLERPGQVAPIWVETIGRPVRGAGGEVVAAVAVYRDVTTKKHELDSYTALAAHIPRAATALFDAELRCLAIDGSLIRDAGRAPAQMIGRPLRELAGFAPDDHAFDAVEALYRRTLDGASLTMDLKVPDRTVALHTAPVRDATGKISAGVVLALDVTRERALQAELRRNAQVYRAIVQHLPRGAVFMIDREYRFVSAEGPIVTELLHLTAEQTFVGRKVEDVVGPANRDALMQTYRRAFEGEHPRREIERDGRFYEVSTVPIYEGDEVTHILVFSFDVTERRRESEALREARDSLEREQALLQSTLANIEDSVALLDEAGTILLCNDPYATMLGLPRDEVRGMKRPAFLDRISPMLEDPEAFRADIARLTAETVLHEYTFARPRRRVMRRSWAPVQLGPSRGFLVTWHDVTAERELLRERERQALVDPLTGVPNRRAAEAALHTEQERSKRTGTPLCVAMFDIDHFKRVNDEHGHAVGDEVLRAVAAALSGEARLTDTVARWGGEEFLAVLNVPLEGARAFCERARKAVERIVCAPVQRLTISAGVAELASGEAAGDALARADAQLYAAKTAGRNRVAG